METKETLKELFDSRKDELAQSLANLSLPKEAMLVQTTVTSYLNKLFDSNGDYRQNLTQSEDYILQAAMSLLNAQQSMIGEFAKSAIKVQVENSKANVGNTTIKSVQNGLTKEQCPAILGGSAVGGTVGALTLGTWGAVFGAIAGTALVLYYASSQQTIQSKEEKMPERTSLPKPEISSQKIKVDTFIDIVSNICDSVDSLILTFRAQINRVVEKYENQEKPTLEKEYGLLLDSIQALLGSNSLEKDEKWQKRLCSRIEDVAESLENYELEIVNYSEATKSFFNETVSENVHETTMVLPAIIKHGAIVRKGKVFIKK